MPWQFNDEERPCARRGVELPWYPSRQGGFRRGVTDASGVMVVISAVREGDYWREVCRSQYKI